jgi:hypothetical protein
MKIVSLQQYRGRNPKVYFKTSLGKSETALISGYIGSVLNGAAIYLPGDLPFLQGRRSG